MNLNRQYVAGGKPLPAVIGHREVHVWKTSIIPGFFAIPDLPSYLSRDEQERALKFLFDRDRERFVQARAGLRFILARYLGRSPSEIALEYDDNGKPFIATAQNFPGLSFNLAHSGDLAMYAVTKDVQIGIDVERHRDNVKTDQLAGRFFSAQEAAALRSLPPDTQREAFFSCWTRKESYLKAIGTGLSTPLHTFSVSVKPNEPPRLLKAVAPDEASAWTLRDIPVDEGFTAAIAVRMKEPRIVLREFQPH